jgi:CRISPR type IV-associated protein Csf1
MWIATKDGITKFKKDDMLGYILNPPEPPFGMYLTRTWQKQGFFKLIDKVNHSQENYFTALDMQVIRVSLSEAKEMAELGEKLREKGLNKKELRTGDILPYHYKNININLIEQLKEYANQKLWRLIVYAIN